MHYREVLRHNRAMVSNVLLALAYGTVVLFVLTLLWSAHPALAVSWAVFVVFYAVIKGLMATSSKPYNR